MCDGVASGARELRHAPGAVARVPCGVRAYTRVHDWLGRRRERDGAGDGGACGRNGTDRESQGVVRVAVGPSPPAPKRVLVGSDGGLRMADDTTVNSGVPSLTVQQAVAAVRANAKGKFNETVDIAVRLGIDPKRSDMIVRGAVSLPHGTGKTVVVCVFAEDEFADEARAAGADIVGGQGLINEIKEKGASALKFDKAVAHPSIMPKLAQIARVLGPRGMMPNPKLGTLTTDITGAVIAMKAGRVEFRAEKNAIVHCVVGKTGFTEKQLCENVDAFMATIMDLRPRAVKGAPSATNYLKGASLSSTMGRGSHRIAKEALLKAAADGAARAKET